MAQAAVLLPRSIRGGQPKDESEYKFFCWLAQHGYKVKGWESKQFPLPDGRSLTPDCMLDSGIFLEHTDADLRRHPGDLPPKIRRKNCKHSRSHLPHILPAAYIAAKRRKIALAEQHYGIVVVLLPCVVRQQMYLQPDLLDKLIKLKLSDPAKYDAYIDEQLEQAAAA